jgi:hypothetical protein
MTRELAWAAARDAGSRSAREHGRTVWNQDDVDCCAKEFDRLWTPEMEAQPQALQLLGHMTMTT